MSTTMPGQSARALSYLQRTFQIEERGSTWRTEILAGATTFLTMAYIVFVNPAILGEAGMPVPAVAAATCLSAAIGCILMGVMANYPHSPGPRDGSQRVLYFYRGEGHGRALADRAGLCLSFPAAPFCC